MGNIAELSELDSDMKGYDSFPVKLGDLMRGERATLGKSLLDVQRDLRVKAAYISAIESCDSSAFQTPGFIAGYVRSYARYLGLDPEVTFAQFCAEAKFSGVHPGISQAGRSAKPAQKKSEPIVSLTKHSSTSFDADPLLRARLTLNTARDGFFSQISASAVSSIFVLAVLVFGIGYGAWTVLQDIQRVEFLPANETPEAQALLPVVGLERKAAALGQLYREKELDVPVMTPRDGPIAALNPDKIGALLQNNGQNLARETADILATSTPRVTEVAPLKVAVVAVRPAWVRLSAADGTVLFERILNGGESFRLPAGEKPTVLRAGNSGAVYITLDGTAYGPVGSGTSVAKNVALLPKAIMKSFATVSDVAELKALDSPRVITLNDLPTSQ